MRSVYQNRGNSVVLQTTDSEYWFLHTNRRQQADDEWILSQRGCMIFWGEDGRLLLTVTRLYPRYDSFAKQQSNNCNMKCKLQLQFEILKYNYVLHTLLMLCAFSCLAWWAMDGGMQGKVISFGWLFLLQQYIDFILRCVCVVNFHALFINWLFISYFIFIYFFIFRITKK